MANIGTFTADKDGFTGTLRTLTVNGGVNPLKNGGGNWRRVDSVCQGHKAPL